MKRLIISFVSVCAVSAVVLAAVLIANVSGAAETKAGSQPSAPAQLGSKDTAKWTDTTVKAAGTPEQKAVLAGGKVATITGELVEVSCYLQLGKRGEAHIPCGSECLKNGQPAGIVDKDGKLTILFVEVVLEVLGPIEVHAEICIRHAVCSCSWLACSASVTAKAITART